MTAGVVGLFNTVVIPMYMYTRPSITVVTCAGPQKSMSAGVAGLFNTVVISVPKSQPHVLEYKYCTKKNSQYVSLCYSIHSRRN